MSKVLLRLLFLLMFVSIVNAQLNSLAVPTTDQPTYCTGFTPTGTTTAGTTPYNNNFIGAALPNYNTNGFATDSIELSLLALTVSFDTIAIAYALSRLFPNLGIRNWLQGEYWEVAKTAILIAVIFGVITIISNITYVFLTPVGGSTLAPTVGNITPLIYGAETYLCNVNSNLMNTWGWMGLLGSTTGFWANLKLGVYDTVPIPPYIALIGGSDFVPFNNWMLQTGNPMIAPYGSVIGDSTNLLLFPFTVITLISVDVLPLMALIGLTFFIPLGLLFRAFPFIRGIGGTLIAIGFGMAVIFPSVLIIFNGVFMNYLQQVVVIAPPQLIDIDSYGGFGSTLTLPAQCPFSASGVSAFGLVGDAFCVTSLAPINAVVPQLAHAIVYGVSDESGVGMLDGANVFSDDAIYQYMDIMLTTSSYIIVQLVLVTVDLVLMFTLTDSIARVLGGTVRFQLGGKLRIAS